MDNLDSSLIASLTRVYAVAIPAYPDPITTTSQDTLEGFQTFYDHGVHAIRSTKEIGRILHWQ
jgi:hypothetical protein